MKNRGVLISGLVVGCGGALGLVLTIFIPSLRFLSGIFYGAMVAGLFLNLGTSVCPHCGKFGHRSAPWKADAETCVHCGKTSYWRKKAKRSVPKAANCE